MTTVGHKPISSMPTATTSPIPMSETRMLSTLLIRRYRSTPPSIARRACSGRRAELTAEAGVPLDGDGSP